MPLIGYRIQLRALCAVFQPTPSETKNSHMVERGFSELLPNIETILAYFFLQGDSDGARRCATSKELISCINEEIKTPYDNFLKTMKSSGERCFGQCKISTMT